MYDIEIIKKINKTDPELARLMLNSRAYNRSSSKKPLKFRGWEGLAMVLVKSSMFGLAVYFIISLFNRG